MRLVVLAALVFASVASAQSGRFHQADVDSSVPVEAVCVWSSKKDGERVFPQTDIGGTRVCRMDLVQGLSTYGAREGVMYLQMPDQPETRSGPSNKDCVYRDYVSTKSVRIIGSYGTWKCDRTTGACVKEC